MPEGRTVEGRAAGGRRLRVAFAGTPTFARTSVAALVDGGHELVGVLTQPDRRAGRGRRLAAGPVKALALEHGLPVLQPPTLRDPEAVEALAALRPDVLVVVAYGLILPPAVLALPPLGGLNVHASLLPRWRGAAPVQRAILAGDAETGVCIMQMDAGLDTGAVLSRTRTPIGPDENASELTERLAGLGAAALGPALDGRRDGTLAAEPQPEEGVTYADKLDKGEAPLDFSCPARALHRQVRALHGWPVAETALAGERLRVWRSRLPEAGTSAAGTADPGTSDSGAPASGVAASGVVDPGTIVSADGDSVAVACGEGVLELLEVQSPGRPAMPAAGFAQGRELVGRRFAPAAAASAS